MNDDSHRQRKIITKLVGLFKRQAKQTENLERFMGTDPKTRSRTDLNVPARHDTISAKEWARKKSRRRIVRESRRQNR